VKLRGAEETRIIKKSRYTTRRKQRSTLDENHPEGSSIASTCAQDTYLQETFGQQTEALQTTRQLGVIAILWQRWRRRVEYERESITNESLESGECSKHLSCLLRRAASEEKTMWHNGVMNGRPFWLSEPSCECDPHMLDSHRGPTFTLVTLW